MSLHTLSVGTAGPRIAFCHGLFGQGRNWMQIAKAVSGPSGTQARALLVDLPDHGRSPWSGAPSPSRGMPRNSPTPSARRPRERWTLVGHSLGGKTAMVAALQHAELIERLCIVDIAPKSYGDLHRFRGYIEGMQRMPLSQLASRRRGRMVCA